MNFEYDQDQVKHKMYLKINRFQISSDFHNYFVIHTCQAITLDHRHLNGWYETDWNAAMSGAATTNLSQ